MKKTSIEYKLQEKEEKEIIRLLRKVQNSPDIESPKAYIEYKDKIKSYKMRHTDGKDIDIFYLIRKHKGDYLT